MVIGNNVFWLSNSAVNVIGSDILVSLKQLSSILCDLIPVEIRWLFAIFGFDTDTNALTVVVNETNVTVATVTASTVFLFQIIGIV